MTPSAAAPLAARPDAAAHHAAEELATLLRRGGLDELAGAAEAEAARQRSARLDVAVLGEFKRGKSSLINALIGHDLAPVGALPLTSIVTRFTHGDAVRVTVELLDGRRVDVAPTAVASYATEQGNAGNVRGVATVTITAPARVLAPRLHLIDTPGIGSVFADVTAIAHGALAQADIALVVLSAEQPASRRELELLRETVATGAPTFLIENKIDLVPAAERAAVLEFVQAQTRALCTGTIVPIFAVSSDRAREAQRRGDDVALAASGVPALVEALRELVDREGATIAARAARRRVLQLVGQAAAARRLRARAAPMAALWHAQRRAQLRQQVGVALLRDLLDVHARAAAAAEALVRDLDRHAAPPESAPALEPILCAVAEGRGVGGVRRWARDAEEALRRALARILNEWSDRERAVLSAAAAAGAVTWRARMAEVLATVAGRMPDVPSPHIEFPPPAVAVPAMRSSRAPLLPGALGRWQVRRRLRRWMQRTWPQLSELRRTAMMRSIADALQHAEERGHRSVIAAFDPMAPVGDPADAPADAIARELDALQRRLLDRDD
jgi:GTPase SAR1 family protein